MSQYSIGWVVVAVGSKAKVVLVVLFVNEGIDFGHVELLEPAAGSSLVGDGNRIKHGSGLVFAPSGGVVVRPRPKCCKQILGVDGGRFEVSHNDNGEPITSLHAPTLGVPVIVAAFGN